MSYLLGLNAKLYRNAGEDWEDLDPEEVKNVRDLTLGLENDEADVSTRASGFKLSAATLTDAPVEFSMVRKPSDANFAALQAAFLAKTPIEMYVLDGPIETVGTQGLHADFTVLRFGNDQNLAEAQMVNVLLKPTLTDNPPEWVTIPEPTP